MISAIFAEQKERAKKMLLMQMEKKTYSFKTYSSIATRKKKLILLRLIFPIKLKKKTYSFKTYSFITTGKQPYSFKIYSSIETY